MTIWIVTAYDPTDYRLTRAFSTLYKAEAFRITLKELLWRKITIDKVVLDKE